MLTSFRTHASWKVHAPQHLVVELIRDTPKYPSWWPTAIDASDSHVDMRRGKLVLRSHFKYVQNTDSVIASRVTGDMSGWYSWRFFSEGQYTRVEYRQQLHFNSTIMRYLGVAMYPILAVFSRDILRSGEAGMVKYFDDLREQGAIL